MVIKLFMLFSPPSTTMIIFPSVIKLRHSEDGINHSLMARLLLSRDDSRIVRPALDWPLLRFTDLNLRHLEVTSEPRLFSFYCMSAV